MNVLIAIASKHGATAEIGEIIQRVIAADGYQPHLREASEVTDLSPYDAVVLGSAVYAGNWRASARKFVNRHGQELRAMPFWIFSSGPLGPDQQTEDDMGPLINKRVAELTPIEHKVFSGKLDPADLKLSEKIIVRMVKAPSGDYRDKNSIVEWAQSIGKYLVDLE